MKKTTILFAALAVQMLQAVPAQATPACLRGHSPFFLKNDTVSYSMKLTRGTDCIQGLRWSFMQIYRVTVTNPPKNGTLVLVGPGFRYYADPEAVTEGDTFTLAVVGKNRNDFGSSTIEIKLEPRADVVAQAAEAIDPAY